MLRRAPRSAAGRAANDDDQGAVTVEAAIALGSLVLVTVAAVGAVATVASSVRCMDAARELARLAARGEPDRGRDVAGRLAPGGAAVVLTTAGDEVVAEVSAAAVPPLPLRIGARAVAVIEPGAVTAGDVAPEPGDLTADATAPGVPEEVP